MVENSARSKTTYLQQSLNASGYFSYPFVNLYRISRSSQTNSDMCESLLDILPILAEIDACKTPMFLTTVPVVLSDFPI